MSTRTTTPGAEPLAGAGGAARNPTPPETPPALKPVELARWGWRQLTSMRTALVLLFLLALAAVPGSVVPQADIDAIAVADWKAAHPALAPVYAFLGLFSVYNSVWFSAIYILLMVSLVGCVVPRLRIYWRGMRALPPKAPRNLLRLPESREFDVEGEPEEVLARAQGVLRRRRYRVERGEGSVAAERGYLREAGNLLFHVSVLVVLVGFAMGQLYGYKGGVITVVGQGFSNSLSQYDDFAPGSLFSADDLSPVSFSVDDFDVSFLPAGPQMGQPKDFSARLTYTERPGAEAQPYDLKVNHPLNLDGVSVFLVGHGYAPVVTVRDGNGDVAYKGPVVFLPQDASFASFGVIKVPDAAPEQLGFEGLFLPTYGFTMARGPFAVPRRPGSAALPGALPRRPRARHRFAPVGLPARQGWSGDLQERRREPWLGRPGHPGGRRHRRPPRPCRVDHPRQGRPLGQAPGQPLARQGHRARRGAARHRGPDGLAVRPAATGVVPGFAPCG